MNVYSKSHGKYNGNYIVVTEEKIGSSTEKPVYKHVRYDMYVFYYPDNDGWRIGGRDSFKGKKHLVKSKSSFKLCLFVDRELAERSYKCLFSPASFPEFLNFPMSNFKLLKFP